MGALDFYRFAEILENFEEIAKIDPFMLGVPHPNIPQLFVYQSPKLATMPSCVFTFTINEDAKVVTLQNAWILT